MGDADRRHHLHGDSNHTVNPAASEVFKALANGTRLATLVALWGLSNPESADAVPFSTLYERVDYDDSSNFHYHLDHLTDHFVIRTEDGYKLSRAGFLLVQLIISGTGIEKGNLDRVPINLPCDFCQGNTVLTYGNGYIYQVCTECPGWEDAGEHHPEGMIRGRTIPPAGLQHRSAEEVFTASWLWARSQSQLRLEGICPTCSGVIENALAICADHHPTEYEACERCDRQARVWGSSCCTVCKDWSGGTVYPKSVLLMHPAIISFFQCNGVKYGFTGTTDFEDILEIRSYLHQADQKIVSTDPPLLQITFHCKGDTLRLLVDETLDVIEETESPSVSSDHSADAESA